MDPLKEPLKYMWVKVMPDGKTSIPQFDPETGQEIQWEEDFMELSKLLLVPFTPEMSEKIMKNNGNICIADSFLPIYEVELKPGDKVISKRVGKFTYFDFYYCQICGNEFQWFGDGQLECPECGARIEWYCRKEDKEKPTQIRFKDGRVECPDCAKKGIIEGLEKVSNLILREDNDLEVYNILEIKNKVRITIDEGKVHIKSL